MKTLLIGGPGLLKYTRVKVQVNPDGSERLDPKTKTPLIAKDENGEPIMESLDMHTYLDFVAGPHGPKATDAEKSRERRANVGERYIYEDLDEHIAEIRIAAGVASLEDGGVPTCCDECRKRVAGKVKPPEPTSAKAHAAVVEHDPRKK